jgi:diguanylate cyclase (GGDEF)-like protein
LAKIFQSCIQKSDTLGRMGGEEFIIVLPKADLSESIKIADRIQKLVEENTINHQEHKISITVSIGVTVWECTDNFNSLYRRVDEALYNAKVDRNSIVVKTTFLEYKIK